MMMMMMMMMMNGDGDGDGHGHGDGDGGDDDDDDDGGKGSAKGKEERTSILIHSLTPDHPPLAAITGNLRCFQNECYLFASHCGR